MGWEMAFSAVFDLGSLTGTTGLILTGSPLSGLSLASGGGDLNGDGLDDLVVSTNNGAGAFNIVYGKPAGWTNTGVPTLTDGTAGFSIPGVNGGDLLAGFRPSTGDVNGDGFEDLLLAAPFASAFAGQAYLVFGRATAPAANLPLATLSAAQGMTVTGLADYNLGWASALGDLNADGLEDLILSEDGAPGSGRAQVIFGRPQGLGGAFDLTNLNGANGFTFTGGGSNGIAVADVNGDGIEDLLSGAALASPGGLDSAGQVEILFGSRKGFATTVAAGAMTAAEGFHNPGTVAGANYGNYLAAAGDFNGDGYGDYLVRGDGGAVDSVTLVFGRADWSTGQPASVRFNGPSGENFGESIASAGDFNGDGFDDILIAARESDPGGRVDAGVVYLILGRAAGYSGIFNLASLVGSNGFRIEGLTANARLGQSVASAGDLNGDGLADIVIGANGVSGGGAAYVIFGVDEGVATLGDDGFTGTAGADARNGLAGNDLIEGLGGDDRMIGGPGTDTAGYRSASANYEWWGRPDGSWAVKDLRTGSPDGFDTLTTFERLAFTDKTVKIEGLTNAEKLTDAYNYVLRATATGVELIFLNGLITAVDGATKTLAQAIGEIVAKADQTTAVAAMSYQFFLGFTPSKGGFDFLVSPQGPNPNNINSAYYQGFNIENRYINFAVNLGKVGEGAASFLAEYGTKTLAEAVKTAYAEIFGLTPSDAKVAAILDPTFVVNGQTFSRAQYFALYGGDGPTGVGTKAAMIGWLLTEAAKADIGVMARASNAFLTDLADGAQTLIDLVGTYAQADWAFGG
jgi:hypothetical protein